MTLQNRLNAFIKLEQYLQSRSSELQQKIALTVQHNSWFTEESVNLAIDGICYMLKKEYLEKWISQYSLSEENPKRIGAIFAGNIPLVGFHDLLSVLITGNTIVAKLSSQDAQLIPHICQKLIEFDAEFKKHIQFVERLNDVDAVIATGSDNSARYFEYYFGKYPHIIRKNRTSVAILKGEESADQLQELGQDIFQYYGLGCRNVSKIYVPIGYKFDTFFKALEKYNGVINHHKYRNNYDYNKSIYLVNKVTHLDNGFLLLTENDQLVSPISVLYYEEYIDTEDLQMKIESNREKIQCIVGDKSAHEDIVPFGKAQKPELWDYADDVDTIKFLQSLN